jgi:hypothetical protein
MTERDRRELHIPYPAYVYDYLLGGNDNLAADRELAELSLQFTPDARRPKARTKPDPGACGAAIRPGSLRRPVPRPASGRFI